MSELASGVHRIDTPLGERFSSLWLIRGRDRSLLFDTGVDTAIPQHVLPYFAEHGIDPESVSWVVVSHADVDHFGGIADVHEQLPAARVGAHPLDAALMEDYDRFEDERVRGFRARWGFDEEPDGVAWCRSVTRADRVDDRLSGGEVLDLGDRAVEVHAVPGHTHGHLALRDTGSGAWFVSDAVLGVSVPLADGTPAFAPTYRYVDDYLRTIDAVERAAPPLLCTAHYGVFAGADALEFLGGSRDFVHELDRATLAALDELGPATLQQLLPVINRQVARWPLDGTEGSLAFPLVGHLERLADRGSVTIDSGPDGRSVVTAKRP